MDHRNHPHWDVLFQQMMPQATQAATDAATPSNPPPPAWVIFCQGSQDFLPFPALKSLIWQGENTLPIKEISASQLVLWDLPADSDQLNALLEHSQAQWVHVLGGKYRSIPLVRPSATYLEGLWRILYKRQSSGSAAVEIGLCMRGLATSRRVVLTGLICLETLQLVTCTLDSANDTLIVQTIQDPLSAISPGWSDPLLQRSCWHVFESALDEVHGFRQWLMTAPMSVIESKVFFEPMASPKPPIPTASALNG